MEMGKKKHDRLSALPINWWIEGNGQSPGITRALKVGWAKVAYRQIEAKLDSNKDDKCPPMHWREFDFAMRYSETYRKQKQEGKKGTELVELLGISTALGFLDQRPHAACGEWLEEAVLYLCRDQPSVIKNASSVFANFYLHLYARNKSDVSVLGGGVAKFQLRQEFEAFAPEKRDLWDAIDTIGGVILDVRNGGGTT